MIVDVREITVSRKFVPRAGTAVGIVIGYGLDDRGVRVPVPVRSRMSTTLSPTEFLFAFYCFGDYLPALLAMSSK
jgi:hypothetical protein